VYKIVLYDGDCLKLLRQQFQASAGYRHGSYSIECSGISEQ